ncbi:hypothetical protein AB0O54_06225 [Pseudarthrobacter oxydans]
MKEFVCESYTLRWPGCDERFEDRFRYMAGQNLRGVFVVYLSKKWL